MRSGGGIPPPSGARCGARLVAGRPREYGSINGAPPRIGMCSRPYTPSMHSPRGQLVTPLQPHTETRLMHSATRTNRYCAMRHSPSRRNRVPAPDAAHRDQAPTRHAPSTGRECTGYGTVSRFPRETSSRTQAHRRSCSTAHSGTPPRACLCAWVVKLVPAYSAVSRSVSPHARPQAPRAATQTWARGRRHIWSTQRRRCRKTTPGDVSQPARRGHQLSSRSSLSLDGRSTDVAHRPLVRPTSRASHPIPLPRARIDAWGQLFHTGRDGDARGRERHPTPSQSGHTAWRRGAVPGAPWRSRRVERMRNSAHAPENTARGVLHRANATGQSLLY